MSLILTMRRMSLILTMRLRLIHTWRVTTSVRLVNWIILISLMVMCLCGKTTRMHCLRTLLRIPAGDAG